MSTYYDGPAVATALAKITGRDCRIDTDATTDWAYRLVLAGDTGQPPVNLSLSRTGAHYSMTKDEDEAYARYRDTLPMIGQDWNRPADALARDIVRRLIPKITAFQAELAPRIARAKLWRTNVDANKQTLCQAGAVKVPAGYNTTDDLTVKTPGTGYTTIHVSETSVSIDLRSLPVELAARIVTLLADQTNQPAMTP